MGSSHGCCRLQTLDPTLECNPYEYQKSAADATQVGAGPVYQREVPAQDMQKVDSLDKKYSDEDKVFQVYKSIPSSHKNSSLRQIQGNNHERYYFDSKMMSFDGPKPTQNPTPSFRIEISEGAKPLKSLPDLKDHPSMQIFVKLQKLPVPQKLLSKYSGEDYFRYGPVLLPSGEVYLGQWRNSNPEGIGLLIMPTGKIYQGEFLRGEMTGQGRLILPTGEVYQGDLKDGKAFGQGELLIKEKMHYSGFWRDNKQHGQGEEVWSDGTRYSGEYTAGQKHGSGKLTWPSGCVYTGQFSKGQMHGRGKESITKAHLNGLTARFLLETGKKEKCKVRENLLGRTAESMSVSLWMEKDVAKANMYLR